MQRRELLKKGCFCGCAAGLSMVLAEGAVFGAEEAKEEKAEEQALDPQQFAQRWVGDLLEALEARVDQDTVIEILEECGRGCARSIFIAEAEKCEGDLDKLLAVFIGVLGEENVIRDKNTVALTFSSKHPGECICPMVKEKSPEVSATICNCTRGWFREVFETVVRKPVQVEILETVKRGGRVCRYKIVV